MMGHKICFNGKIGKIIPKLSLLPLLSGALLLTWLKDKSEYAKMQNRACSNDNSETIFLHP